MRLRGGRLSTTFLILLVSRVLGMGRELIISAAFGFSRITDLFYQSTFPISSLLTITNGPFTTAFGARLNQSPVEARVGHIRYYAHLSVKLGIGLSAFSVAIGAVLLAFPKLAMDGMWLAVLILTPALFNMLYAGYVYAVATAMGKISAAAWVLFVNNALFVFIICGFWLAKFPLQSWTLPAAYLVGTFISLITGFYTLRSIETEFGIGEPDDASVKPLPGLLHSFAFAGAETLFFIGTQSIVLILATRTGPGWVSALSTTQRLSFSINGLVISPVASLLMLSVVNGGQPLRAFLKTVGGAFAGLAFFAIALVASSHYIMGFAVHAHKFPQKSAEILLQLLPAYGLWLVPLGINIIVCRVMFGLKMDRLYTVLTLPSYLVANIVRVGLSLSVGFVWGIAGGAAVELACVILLTALVIGRLLDGGDRRNLANSLSAAMKHAARGGRTSN